jgi:hypothetical protein
VLSELVRSKQITALRALTRQIDLTELPGSVDTGDRALVKIDRVTGLYSRNDWSIDANGKSLALRYSRIGPRDIAGKSRF